MSGRPISPLAVSAADRAELERLIGSRGVPKRVVTRARMIMGRADGLSRDAVARANGCSTVAVSKWTARYRAAGISGLMDRRGRGRKKREAPSSHEPSVGSGRRKKRCGESDKVPVARDATPDGRSAPPVVAGEAQEPEASVYSVARIAGVSATTVSRVLSGKHKVTSTVRSRVLDAVKTCGYRPDPELRKLMAYLRGRRVKRLQGTICCLEESAWEPGQNIYERAVVGGARTKAAELGFGWESMDLESILSNPRRGFGVIRARGVEGILVPPLFRQRDLAGSKLWSDFSVVAATYSVSSPSFHRVVPDHFRNMDIVCRELAHRGRRRIGLAIPVRMDERVGKHYTGAYAAFHYATRQSVPPMFLFDGWLESRRVTRAFQIWFSEVSPDAIVVESHWIARWLKEHPAIRLPRSTVVAALSTNGDWPVGINELPERVGATAADMLARMIAHRERGVPGHALVTMVEGSWVG